MEGTAEDSNVVIDADFRSSACWPTTVGEPALRIITETIKRAAIRKVAGMLVEHLTIRHWFFLLAERQG
jgi:hypothetical protein